MINKVIVTLLRQFLGSYCLSKLIIRLTYHVFLISFLFRIVSIQNQFHLPLTVSRLVLSFQAYYKVYSRCLLNIIVIYVLFYPESISFTSVQDH